MSDSTNAGYTRIEIVEHTMREYRLKLPVEEALEYVSALYSNFAHDGIRPPGGKVTAHAVEIRSYTAVPPKVQIIQCDHCQGKASVMLDGGVHELCPKCDGTGAVLMRPNPVPTNQQSQL